MIARNFSPYEAFLAAGRAHVPQHRYRDGMDVAAWQDVALPDVLATLGRLPDPVPPRAELLAEFLQRDVITQRWVIDVQEGLSAIAVVNRPVDASGPLPGILCWHGHSDFGKEPIMGNRSSAGLRNYVADTGLDYGYSMAAAGYVTFAIDWMGQGDRNDGARPNNRELANASDSCNIYFLNATMLGMTTLGMNLIHGRRLLDFVAGLDFVDETRIGVMGESYGGTLALWTTLTDNRIRATEIICYSDSFADFALRDLNYCGSQITPGLFALVDVSDLQGLIAPRPLMVDIAAFDDCFLLPSAVACVDRVEGIYAAAGASDRFARQLFDIGHGWQQRDSEGFFARHLA